MSTSPSAPAGLNESFAWPSLRIGQIRVDAVTQAEAIDVIDMLIAQGEGGRVYTPNIDHVVMAEDDSAFRAAYDRVSLSLADGFPIVVTSKLTKTRLPEKVSGSDLVLPLLARAEKAGHRVFLFGGPPGVAEAARDVLLRKYPALKIVGCASPMVDLKASESEFAALAAPIAAAGADLVLVALGAPKQELFIDRVAQYTKPAVLLGIGASLDFIAGRVKRAPKWMADNGLEWLYRLNQERGRLWRRYLRDTRYPLIVMRHALKAQLETRGTR